MIIIRCNNCYSQYEEEDFNVIECSQCKTDEYLMEIEEDKQQIKQMKEVA
jgi:hypothetical protein